MTTPRPPSTPLLQGSKFAWSQDPIPLLPSCVGILLRLIRFVTHTAHPYQQLQNRLAKPLRGRLEATELRIPPPHITIDIKKKTESKQNKESQLANRSMRARAIADDATPPENP